nr:MAG TPA: hypothetical protein [Caudoviricetes sp.]
MLYTFVYSIPCKGRVDKYSRQRYDSIRKVVEPCRIYLAHDGQLCFV